MFLNAFKSNNNIFFIFHIVICEMYVRHVADVFCVLYENMDERMKKNDRNWKVFFSGKSQADLTKWKVQKNLKIKEKEKTEFIIIGNLMNSFKRIAYAIPYVLIYVIFFLLLFSVRQFLVRFVLKKCVRKILGENLSDKYFFYFVCWSQHINSINRRRKIIL